MMRIDAPFVLRSGSEIQPGDVALISYATKHVYMLAIVFPGGSTSTLILEGEDAGQLYGEAPGQVIVHKGKPTIRMPLRSDAWSNSGPPSVPLNVATDGEAYYFIISSTGRLTAVNIETGVVTGMPHRLLYTDKWSIDYINIDGEPVEFIQSKVG